MPRLTQDQWETIRAEREAGSSFPDLAARHGVSHQAIQKRAKNEGWADGQDVQEIIRRKVMEKVAKVVAGENPAKKAAAIDSAADEVVSVIRRHREEWQDHADRFRARDIQMDFEIGKSAKISAEMLRIRQDGERKAWGIDVTDGRKVTDMSDEELAKLVMGKK
jgi:hypothetical protein